MRWFREARQIPYSINSFIVDQHIPKSLFRMKSCEAIRWRRSNTSNTSYPCRCKFLDVTVDIIYHTYFTISCNYMDRWKKNMDSWSDKPKVKSNTHSNRNYFLLSS